MKSSALQKGSLIYEGKAKKIFSVSDHSDLLWVEFKNSLTAFNAAKKGSFEGKGSLNRNITSLIFRYLQKNKVETHWVSDVGEHEMVSRKLDMILLEVVVRNVLAGSTAKKFQIEEGTPLDRPLVEFFYKNDVLGDPFVSDEQALMLKASSNQQELNELKRMALTINEVLIPFFAQVGIRLIDFKLEMGRSQGKIVLGDEITPDSCRLWQEGTNEKLDKDRFRRDLGRVKESYEQVYSLLQSRWGEVI